jgi:hypothetical protein
VYLLLSSFIIAMSAVWGALRISGELKRAREETAGQQALALITLFAPGVAAAVSDPRALLAWQPLAAAARKIAPEAFAELDRAAGAAFPFSPEQIQAAHSRWTADWLAWERTHDAEYKLKAAVAEAEVASSGGSPLARAQFDTVEREKLELYQQRYTEYVQTAKALQVLLH